MDLVSHAIVGKVFEASTKLTSWRHRLIVISFAVLPDLPVAFVYLLLGRAKGRPFWIPLNSDWIGVRAAHPVWSAMWEIPHSLFFLLAVIVPLVYLLQWPKIAIASYFSHIFLDLFTHTGEWCVKPFYPLPYMVEGFTDAWKWPISYMAVSWSILLVFVVLLERRRS